MRATQAGRGDVEMHGHRRLPQKGGDKRRANLFSVPTSSETAKGRVSEEIFIPLRTCIFCGSQTRSWASVSGGEAHVCSKECYDNYEKEEEGRREGTRKKIKSELVLGPGGHPWPKELLSKIRLEGSAES